MMKNTVQLANRLFSRKNILLIFLFILCSSQLKIYQPPQPDKYEGDQPYTPTRLEWLTSSSQSECGIWLNGIPTVYWGLFNGEGTKDTITILVHLTDERMRIKAQQAAEMCERSIHATAKERRWNWLKTKVQVGHRDNSKKITGFKIVSIEKGSVYEKLGLQQGDLIKSINGKPVNSIQDTMELTHLMKSSATIEIELFRDGLTQKMTYHLK